MAHGPLVIFLAHNLHVVQICIHAEIETCVTSPFKCSILTINVIYDNPVHCAWGDLLSIINLKHPDSFKHLLPF